MGAVTQQQSPPEPVRFSRYDPKVVALDHAWSWYSLHGGQRMQVLNFFLVAVSFFTVGLATLANAHAYLVAGGVALFGALISVEFFLLEKRTDHLVHLGRDAIRALEKELGQSTACDYLELMVGADKSRDRQLRSYKTLVPLIQWTCVVGFAFGAAWAFFQAAP